MAKQGSCLLILALLALTTAAAQETLRGVAPQGFLIGTAVAGGGHHGVRDPFRQDELYRQVLAAEFNSVTLENWLKWEEVHPVRGEFDFGPVDEVLAFAREHRQAVRGHTLVWHNQNPTWLTEGTFTPDELRTILREHIHTVVGRYRGQIDRWDVVNEVIDDGGELRDTIWLRHLGPGYIADAFRWAHEADPDAKLFLNDYNVEGINRKSDAYYELVQELLADGVPVHGFAAQGHLAIQYPFPGGVRENLQRFSDLGLATAFTEVSVRMVLPPDGVPTEAQLERQADFCRRLLQACLSVDSCREFTVWGFNDEHSWVMTFFPGQGAPSIMRGDYSRKPAYYALLSTLAEGRLTPQGAAGLPEPKPEPKSTGAVRGTPVIDGVKDPIWLTANEIETNTWFIGTEGATARVRTMWDDDRLYVWAHITDGHLSKVNANPWEQDSFEIFVDQNHARTDFYQPDDGQFRVNFDNEQSFRGNASSANFTAATRLVDGGYIVEAAITLDHIRPEAGLMLGFDVQVNDDNGAGFRTGKVTWHDPTGASWTSTANLGVLRLLP